MTSKPEAFDVPVIFTVDADTRDEAITIVRDAAHRVMEADKTGSIETLRVVPEGVEEIEGETPPLSLVPADPVASFENEDGEEAKEIFITMSIETAEKLRHFLQEHNVGETDISDVYQVLLTVTENLGITGKHKYQNKMLSQADAFSSPFFKRMKAEHEAKQADGDAGPTS